jgi:hypothetical protein
MDDVGNHEKNWLGSCTDGTGVRDTDGNGGNDGGDAIVGATVAGGGTRKFTGGAEGGGGGGASGTDVEATGGVGRDVGGGTSIGLPPTKMTDGSSMLGNGPSVLGAGSSLPTIGGGRGTKFEKAEEGTGTEGKVKSVAEGTELANVGIRGRGLAETAVRPLSIGGSTDVVNSTGLAAASSNRI